MDTDKKDQATRPNVPFFAADTVAKPKSIKTGIRAGKEEGQKRRPRTGLRAGIESKGK